MESHLPLELTIDESRSLLKETLKTKNLKLQSPQVRTAIAGGEKLLNWIELINKNRAKDQKIRLTSKGTQRGIPIDKPKKYGPSTIAKDLSDIKTALPEIMKDVVYGKGTITAQNPISDKEFIKFGRQISKLYQTSVRWTSLSSWLGQYEARKAKDVRGYYFLKHLRDLDQTLRDIRGLDPLLKEQILNSLQSVCENNYNSISRCKRELDRAAKSGDVLSYKKKYWQGAIRNWESFFKISNPRTDVEWKENTPGVMTVSFKDPRNPEIANWLKENIEDEFKFPLENWNLEMKFIRGGWSTAYIEFRKNVTPHVSGGNKIVMDANTDIQEYGVRWTIRHEYGHILRLPDCYHEFYDRSQNLMINYQFDVTDLMCSRAGLMNERIYQELKRVYFNK